MVGPDPESYVEELLARLLSTESEEPQTKTWESGKTISWKAHREAEQLVDPDLIPILCSVIEKESNPRTHDGAYFILGKLGAKLNDGSVAQFLINRTAFERDKHIISSLFDIIADIPKPMGTDLTILTQATRHKEWLIRHAAIGSLKRCDDPLAEMVLIDILRKSADPFDIIYANSVLIEIGTVRAIPVLEEHTTSRKRDVKDTARRAIDAILERNEQKN